MTTKQKPSADAGRARLIKLVHVARRDLERAGTLDEPGYRDILRAASGGGHDSAAAMSYADLKAALERLKRAGFKVRKPAGSRSMTVNPDASKVRALWLFLHAIGAVRDPSEQALAAYVRRTVKVDDLRWAHGEDSTLLIETLKMWAMRYLPAALEALRVDLVAAHKAQPLTEAQLERANAAQQCLLRGEGFDMHRDAWEALMDALQRPVAGEVAGSGR